MTPEDRFRYNELDLMIWDSFQSINARYLRRSWYKEMMDIKNKYPDHWSIDDESSTAA